MILEGFRLLVIGMFTVFAFLTLLVGMMTATAAFFERFAHRFPEEAPEASRSARSGNEREIALAIALAEVRRRGKRV